MGGQGKRQDLSAETRSMTQEDRAARQLAQLISAGQPMLMEVGHLGAQYPEWVHKPVTGQPRFFQSSSAEAISKTPWWLVPLLWIPVCCGLVLYAALALCSSPQQLCGHLAGGVLLWQLFEYSIHRFLFHAIPTSYTGIMLHFTFHGCHHKFPLDQQRLVFPPLPAAVVTAGIFWAFCSLMPQAQAVALATGMLIGYTFYDCIHFCIHHCQPSNRLMKKVRSAHLSHHYRDSGSCFGISSPLVDVLLGTLPAHLVSRPAS